MKKLIACTVFIAIIPITARAATCDAGYYLNNGECLHCNPNAEPYYCPGDDIRHPCPTTDTDYNQFGYTRIGGIEAAWAELPAKRPTNCRSSLLFRDEYNNRFWLEDWFNGENYWGNRKLWHFAGPGYYLSNYWWTSNKNWYHGVKPCTNAPQHAHYTGPGTPDDPVMTGGTTDYNDCPWECDENWGRHDDVCVQLCDAGIQHIKTGNGLTFNLYPIAYSTPALHVNYNSKICYGTLASGNANGAINIQYAGQIYHTID